MIDRSAVVAVEIDLGVVVLADAEAHGLVFVITLLPPHCLLFLPIVFCALAFCLVPVCFLFLV
jgi:hypothetical protein